jgi:branched-chain amino acid aminotransferase
MQQKKSYIEYIWLDGKHQKKIDTELLISDLDYSAGISEIIRVYNGNIFQLELHLKRIIASSEMIMMNINFSIKELMEACLELVESNHIENGYIRLLLFLSDQYTTRNADEGIHVMLTCRNNLTADHVNLTEKKALRLNISSIIKPSPEFQPYHVKANGLYIMHYVAKKHAIEAGYDDSLMFDYHGFVADTSSANFFMVKDVSLYTPTTKCCLDGITRQNVIDIAKQNNIEVIEKDITREELFESDEAFAVNTIDDITPIASILSHEYKANPVSQLIYSKLYQQTQELITFPTSSSTKTKSSIGDLARGNS